MTVIAKDDIPNVIPPIAKKPIINNTRNKLNDIPNSTDKPESTPPSILFEIFLFI